MLSFPFGATPPESGALEVAPGVLWLRRPLPWAVNHVNVWALADGDGWTIVDTGLATAGSVAAWDRDFESVLKRRPVLRVICTHMHRDHVGLAGWFVGRFGCRLWMTRMEYFASRLALADAVRDSTPETLAFQHAAGWGDDTIHHHRGYQRRFGEDIVPIPGSYRRMQGGEEIAVGRWLWRVVIGVGHSPEHLCLYSPQLQVLISGDQVLPEITTNVSVQVAEPDGDPLSEWIDSLAGIRREVSDDVLVLPAHGAPFRGLHARLDALADGHERDLATIAARLVQPQRAVDLFPLLFRRNVGLPLYPLATGESLAHLNCLIGRGHVQRETDAAGVHWYRAR